MGFREGLVALSAAESLQAVSVASKAFAFYPAVVAGHGRFPLETHRQKPDNGLGQSVRLRLCGFQPR